MRRAQHEVRVGDRDLFAALVVANRPGVRPGALRADAQEAALVDPGDAAAAGADRGEVDERRGNRQPPLDLVVGVVGDLPVPHDADVTARAAHVERDEVFVPGQLAEEAATDHAAAQPRQHNVDGLVFGGLRCGPAAVRLHHRPGTRDAQVLQALPNATDVALQRRLDIGIRENRATALVLPPDRRHLVGERHGHVGEALGEILLDAPLMLGIQMREQQANGDNRFGAGIGAGVGSTRAVQSRRDPLRQPLQHLIGQRDEHVAFVVDALVDLETVDAFHQRLRLRPFERIVVAPIDALNEGDVAKSLRGHEQNPRPAALE